MRRWLNHETPWGVEYSDFFVTICCRPKGLNQLCWPEKAQEIIRTLELYHQKHRWFCSVALWMPDHVHLIVRPGQRERFSKLVGDFKRCLTKKIGVRWHRGFFDHRIRRHELLEQTWKYIDRNPLRAGLVQCPKDWAYRWEPVNSGAQVMDNSKRRAGGLGTDA